MVRGKAIAGYLKYIVVFITVAAVLTGLLVLAAKIPQKSIQDNVLKSAEYLCEGELFGMAVDGAESSTIDRYADSILLAIAYQYDSRNTLTSIVWSAYYNNPIANENENLYTAVTEGREANTQYLRYWHGSNVIVRPLLAVLDIKQIYVLNAVVMGAFIIALLVILLKKKAFAPAAGFAVGLLVTAVWFVPLSLEYTWTFLLMLLMSVICVILAYKKCWTVFGVLFMVGGMLTNYLDFLTTETLTLTVPLLFVLWIRYHEEACMRKELVTFTVTTTALWGAGYVGMWLAKWGLSAIVLGENVMPYISEHISERLNGNVGISTAGCIIGAVLKNVSCLFSLEYGIGGAFAGIAGGILVLYIGYVYYDKKADKAMLPIYICIALIPYIRYMILHNHSYLHAFFTYRSQMATIMAVFWILELLTGGRWLSHGRNRRKRT